MPVRKILLALHRELDLDTIGNNLLHVYSVFLKFTHLLVNILFVINQIVNILYGTYVIRNLECSLTRLVNDTC